jgi:hypothetical protein
MMNAHMIEPRRLIAALCYGGFISRSLRAAYKTASSAVQNGFEAWRAPGRRRRALKRRRPRLGGSGAFSKEAAIGGIIGFDSQTRETGKGSNNNAAQAEYDRLAALSYSLKSLKSSSH